MALHSRVRHKATRKTRQQQDLAKYVQLWLSADEWTEPLAVMGPLPDNLFEKRRIVAWVVDRR